MSQKAARRMFFVFIFMMSAVQHNPVQAQSQSAIHSNGKSTYSYIDSDRDYSLNVEIEGDIEFTDDDSNIRSISEGGYLEIEEENRGVKHYVRIEGESGGQLSHTYRLNNSREDFESEGRTWFSGILLQVIRDTGIGAEGRVTRILAEDGIDGVLNEVDQIRRGSVQIRYLNHLYEKAELSTPQLVRGAGIVAEVRSSGDKSRFLIKNADVYFEGEGAYPAYFETLKTVRSSGDKSRVLIHLFEQDNLNHAGAYLEALQTTKDIRSSGDKSRVLIKAAPLYTNDAGQRQAYFEAVNSVQSSGDHARVLITLIETENLDGATLRALLESAKSIRSSGDKTRVLIRVAGQVADDDGLVEVYLDTAESIRSSGDKKRALAALLE